MNIGNWKFSLRSLMLLCLLLCVVFAYVGRQYFLAHRKAIVTARIREQANSISQLLDNTAGDADWWKTQLGAPNASVNGGYVGTSMRHEFTRDYKFSLNERYTEQLLDGSTRPRVKTVQLCDVQIAIHENGLEFPLVNIHAQSGDRDELIVDMLTQLCRTNGWEWKHHETPIEALEEIPLTNAEDNFQTSGGIR